MLDCERWFGLLLTDPEKAGQGEEEEKIAVVTSIIGTLIAIAVNVTVHLAMIWALHKWSAWDVIGKVQNPIWILNMKIMSCVGNPIE